MKGFRIALVLIFAVAGWVGNSCAITAQEVAEKPTVFCNVINPPDALLMGGWKCIFSRHTETGEMETNPAEYWLVKYEDQYGLYFYRIAREGRKRYIGWRAWTLNGNEITSDTGVRIFAEKKEVYFQWKDEKPVKMTRMKNK